MESVFNLEFQPKSGIQLGIPIPMVINLGECMTLKSVGSQRFSAVQRGRNRRRDSYANPGVNRTENGAATAASLWANDIA